MSSASSSFLRRHRDLAIRFFKFGMVGGSGVVVNLGLYWILTRWLGFESTYTGRTVSYMLSVEVSILTNFVLNDIWTFQDRRQQQSLFGRFWRFHLVSLVGFLLNVGIFALLNWALVTTQFTLLGELTLFGKTHTIDDLLAACIGIGVAMVWNFVANLRITWRG
jgi:dolichol-phosphate mannosyltransferase